MSKKSALMVYQNLKNITEENLEEGILGIISSIDKPLSPFGEAMSDFTSSLDNKDPEKRLNFRAKVKECTVKDLINVSSKYLLSGSSKSVIAGENYIEEIKQLNFEIKNIDSDYNGEVTLGIRPEHLIVSENGLINLKVELVEQLGSDNLVYGQIKNIKDFCYRSPGKQTIKKGETLSLNIEENKYYIFDKSTGKRVN